MINQYLCFLDLEEVRTSIFFLFLISILRIHLHISEEHSLGF